MHSGKQYNQRRNSIRNVSRSLQTNQSWLFTCTPFLRVFSFQAFVRCSSCVCFSLTSIRRDKKGLNTRLKLYVSVSGEQRDPWFLPRRGGCRQAAERSGCNLWHAAETCPESQISWTSGALLVVFRVSSRAQGLHTCKMT